ncbi:MAG: hypothetical protein K9K66_11955 [Desulfarculaceae bacterium]|nr:hypothetical protein [Desulfarculaceae bacterium]MCF8071545.1 hypothetical protein [Desulfarculaceae bacterium]MCF8102360.1 hypothetical protein [Desulfarculaceae bacterium]MCF8114824.1 hypothetical protein [Desulfarculaceae bacterium]
MQGKSMIVDTSLCTACRGCQVACKQWHGLPGTKTKQTGTYQNPPDLSADTYKLVRFAEGRKEDGKPYWHFFSDSCRHCLDPGCMAGDQNNSIVQDKRTGAVLYTQGTRKLNYRAVREGCPYNIPRQDPRSKVLCKCDMCIDRLRDNMVPACVQACPTGALHFGDRRRILHKVALRVVELKKHYPKARALNPQDVRVVYIVTDDPDTYFELAEA